MNNFKKFLTNFQMDKATDIVNNVTDMSSDSREDPSSLDDFYRDIGGQSFANGAYRTLCLLTAQVFLERVQWSFPAYRGMIIPIAYDWLNRVYCLDLQRLEKEEPQMLLFSHLSDEVLQIPFGIEEFHEEALVETSEEILELDLFKRFLSANKMRMLGCSECGSLITPLFMGGSFDITNLALVDVEVDWTINHQLLIRSRSMDSGQGVGAITLDL